MTITMFCSLAELLGSRGWAKMNNRPQPKGADYDYCLFTDDQARLDAVRKELLGIAKDHDFDIHERGSGYVTVSGMNVDLSVLPTAKRDELILAYEMRDAGLTKKQMCLLLDKLKLLRLRRGGAL